MGTKEVRYEVIDLYKSVKSHPNIGVTLTPRLMSKEELKQKINSMAGQGWRYKDQVVGENGETKFLIFEKTD